MIVGIQPNAGRKSYAQVGHLLVGHFRLEEKSRLRGDFGDYLAGFQKGVDLYFATRNDPGYRGQHRGLFFFELKVLEVLLSFRQFAFSGADLEPQFIAACRVLRAHQGHGTLSDFYPVFVDGLLSLE